MLRELNQLLPEQASTLIVYLAMAGACAGVGLWLTGARMSRGLITLSLVSTGGLIGLRLPGWMGWEISGMAMAVGLALAGGLWGFIFHRLWVGVGMGLVLALWAIVGCWVMLHGDYQPAWQEIDVTLGAAGVAEQLWNDLPEALQTWWPVAAGAGLLSGIVMTLAWPRVTIVTLYSLVGVSMVVGLGMLAMNTARPQWLERLPQQTWSQVAWLAGLVVVGAAVQWQLMPRRSRAAAAEPEAPEQTET